MHKFLNTGYIATQRSSPTSIWFQGITFSELKIIIVYVHFSSQTSISGKLIYVRVCNIYNLSIII